MAIRKIGMSKKNIISNLNDQPTQTATQLKAKFDEASNFIIDYLNNEMVEDIESELRNKADTVSLTGNKALVSNSSGKVDESTTTLQELSYLSGVTSPLQEQLNTKEDKISLGNNIVPITDGNGLLISSQIQAGNLRNITYGTSEPDSSDGLTDGSVYLKVIE